MATVAQNEWITRVLGAAGQPPAAARQTASEAAATNAPVTDEAQLRNWLAVLLLHIAPYARDANQEADWLARARIGEDAIPGDPAKATEIFGALGDEIMGAAKAARAQDAPFTRWTEAWEACVRQAGAAKPLFVEQLESAGMSDAVASFESGWSTFEDELAEVNDIVERGMMKARKLPRADRGAAVARVVTEAEAAVAGSTMLAQASETGSAKLTVANDLRAALAALRRDYEKVS